MEGNYKKWLNRINAKQDVLTEDNVGQFMDSELSTKSAPTSGDTVLAMDSVTGKAVKIPTDQLGGNVDLTTKLNKGSYPGNASDLKNDIDGKLNKPTLSDGNVPKWNSSVENFVAGAITNTSDGKIGISKPNPDETLDVGGNIKGVNIKDQYGTLKSQRCITITGNTTLSEIHNGAVLNVTNTCNITIPTGLDSNFQCVIFAKGSIVVTFVNSGVTIYAPTGLLLKQDKMASLICTATNNFNLTGELTTS